MPRMLCPSLHGVRTISARSRVFAHGTSSLELDFRDEDGGQDMQVYDLHPDIARAYADAINEVTRRFTQAPASEAAE